MSNAINNPVRGARKETSNADFPLGQKADIVLEQDQPIDRTQIIVAEKDTLDQEYAAALAFAEEPVEIYIHPSSEKNAPIVVDCWVNGRGAEVFVGGRWHQFNCLPVAQNVTTKRKYVEVLARSKIDTISTEHDDTNVERPKNIIRRSTSSNCTFQVVGDKNPKGREWLRLLMANRG